MGFTAVSAATGEGSALFDSGTPHAPFELFTTAVVLTGTKVRQIYQSEPIFLQFAGQVMLGNPDQSPVLVMQSFPIHWLSDTSHIPVENQTCTGLFWKLPPGMQCDIGVGWS